MDLQARRDRQPRTGPRRAAANRPNSHERGNPDEKTRRDLIMDAAAQNGWLGPEKDGRITGRVPRALIEAARAKAPVASDTELVTYALAKVALEDDFGEVLLSLRGSVPASVDLEF